LITLGPVGGTSEVVGGATWPPGRGSESTFTLTCDLELSRTLVVLRSHISAAESSVLLPASHRQTALNRLNISNNTNSYLITPASHQPSRLSMLQFINRHRIQLHKNSHQQCYSFDCAMIQN